jgi:hypothetical protein
MFSDKYKPLKVIIPLLIILIMVFYGINKIPQIYPGYENAIKTPSVYIGKEIYASGKITQVDSSYLVVSRSSTKLIANNGIGKNTTGSQINGKAIFNKDKSVTFTAYHTSNLRGYKIWLSLLPTVLITYLFFKQYRFKFKKMLFEHNKL